MKRKRSWQEQRPGSPRRARIDPAAAFGFVKANQASHSVRRMCGLLGVSPSGYYAWLIRSPSARQRTDRALRDRIVDIHVRSRGTYGAPRIHAELSFEGVCVGRKRVARLMRQARIQGIHRRRKYATTRRNPVHAVAPDLVCREFTATGPDRIWVADVERHEAFSNRAVVKGHRFVLVAAGILKLRAA